MRLWIAFCCALFSSMPAAARAQQPTRILIPVPAGGNIDLSVRILVDSLKDQLKRTFIIENRPVRCSDAGARSRRQGSSRRSDLAVHLGHCDLQPADVRPTVI